MISAGTARRATTPARSRPVRLRVALAAIAALFLAKHVVTALVFPPFTGHDEVAHYGYLKTVALEGRLPRLEDPLPPELTRYRSFALDWSEGPGYQYAAVHPPLYYVLMAAVVRARPAAPPEWHLYVARLAGGWIGLATVLLAWALTRETFPHDSFLAVTVPLLVAFQPQVSYEAAVLNNDALGIASASCVVWLIARGMRTGFPARTACAVGLALGAALLAKSTALVLAPAVVLAVCLTPARSWFARVRTLGLVAFLALLVSAPWYLHMYGTYGDFTGLARLAELQHTWNRSLGTFPELLFSTSFLVDRFRETWGGFGWRRALLDPDLLWAIGLLGALAAVGLVRWGMSVSRLAPPWHSHDDALQGRVVLVLLCGCVLGYVAVVQFGTRFALTQARYYFPLVNAAALPIAIGLRELTPARYRPAAQAALFALLILLTLMIFTRAVVPAWYFPR